MDWPARRSRSFIGQAGRLPTWNSFLSASLISTRGSRRRTDFGGEDADGLGSRRRFGSASADSTAPSAAKVSAQAGQPGDEAAAAGGSRPGPPGHFGGEPAGNTTSAPKTRRLGRQVAACAKPAADLKRPRRRRRAEQSPAAVRRSSPPPPRRRRIRRRPGEDRQMPVPFNPAAEGEIGDQDRRDQGRRIRAVQVYDDLRRCGSMTISGTERY